MRVPLYKRLLSYLYPVRIKKLPGNINPALELLLYNNRWQLATRNALYSDGHMYRPMVTAFKAMRDILPGLKDILLLGTGLASAVHVLHRMGIRPDSVTMVDIDEEVLLLALQCLPENTAPKITPVCADARTYMGGETSVRDEASALYDLVIVDVFIGRTVPEEISGEMFLRQCRDRINPGGRFVMNYMVEQLDEWLAFRKRIATVFPQYTVLEFGLNKIIIGSIPGAS